MGWRGEESRAAGLDFFPRGRSYLALSGVRDLHLRHDFRLVGGECRFTEFVRRELLLK